MTRKMRGVGEELEGRVERKRSGMERKRTTTEVRTFGLRGG